MFGVESPLECCGFRPDIRIALVVRQDDHHVGLSGAGCLRVRTRQVIAKTSAKSGVLIEISLVLRIDVEWPVGLSATS